ncbi:MAG: prepilin-type N-terminal cleavage/methylation domain-containing protein [Epsilonproteobacteria bacterium]|nr:prepilin-type N-terminal cleavage/methylation domain-containing protein [Campylobacterota bacterium]
MKKAFTMLELVFVIVVVGIMAYVAVSSFSRNPLREAADQLVSHIRYTQHLAMMDDKFDLNDASWYKSRWQIFFANTVGSGNTWSYMIFSDSPNYTGTPDIAEHAKNPIDTNKYLSGGYSAGNIDSTSALATTELNLGNEYGILDIDFVGGCTIANTRQRISFDYLGRPFYGIPHVQTSIYHDELNLKLLKATCRIELCTTSPCATATIDNKIIIAIEPETGYTHIQ